MPFDVLICCSFLVMHSVVGFTRLERHFHAQQALDCNGKEVPASYT